MLNKLFSYILMKLSHHPRKLIFGIMLITSFFMIQISNVDFRVSIVDYLPSNNPKNKAFEKILNEFGNDSNIFLIASGHTDDLLEFSLEIKPVLESFTDWVSSVDDQQSMEFLKKNLIKLMDLQELKEFGMIYNDPNLIPLLSNINQYFETSYLELDQPTKQQNKKLDIFLDKISTFIEIQKKIITNEIEIDNSKNASDVLLYGNQRKFSDDGEKILIRIEPNFNMNYPIGELIQILNELRSIVRVIANKYDVDFSLTGPMVRKSAFFENFLFEIKYIAIISTFIFLLIMTSLFRKSNVIYFCFIPISLSFVWILGLYGYFSNILDLMKLISLCVSILFVFVTCISFLCMGRRGLFQKNSQALLDNFFIDFLFNLLKRSFFISFFSICIYFSEIKVISMIGLWLGIGVMLSTVLVIIYFLIILVMFNKKKKQKKLNKYEFIFINDIIIKSFLFIKSYKSTVMLSIISITLFLSYYGRQLVFESNPSKIYYDFNNAGEKDLIKSFGFSSDLLTSVIGDIDTAYKIVKKIEGNDFIGYMESYSDYIPNTENSQNKFRFINDFQRKLNALQLRKNFSSHDYKIYKNEIKRLEGNIIDIQHYSLMHQDYNIYDKTKKLVDIDLNGSLVGMIPDLINSLEKNSKKMELTSFQDNFSRHMKATLLLMSNTQPLDVHNIPIEVSNRLSSNNSNNQFRINIYPKNSNWEDYDDLLAFENHSFVSSLMLHGLLNDNITSLGLRELIICIIAFIILIMINHNSKRSILVMMLSLFMGTLWMLSGFVLLNESLNIINLFIFPFILIISLNYGLQLFEYDKNQDRFLIDKVEIIKSNLFIVLLVFMLLFPLSFSANESFVNIPIMMLCGLITHFLSNFIIFGLFYYNKYE